MSEGLVGAAIKHSFLLELFGRKRHAALLFIKFHVEW
jgi:hypothetical protein